MPAYIPNCIKLEIAKPMKIMLYILEPFTLPNSAIVYGKKIIIFDPSSTKEKNLYKYFTSI
jgi:hypothetical protein